MLKFIVSKWKYLVAAALLIFLILIPFDWFLGQYTSIMIFIGISTIVTVGLCLLMGYTGQVSLGQAAFYGLGAYFSAVLSKSYDVNPWLAMLIAAVATGLFAFIIGYPIFRLRGNYLAMATLGIGLIIYILFRQLIGITGGPDGMAGIPYLSIGGFEFDTNFKRYFLVWFFCLSVLFLSQNIVRSRTGRALRAIHGSEVAAESIGINVTRFKVKIFVLSAVYASLAGSLFVHHLRFVSPQTFDFLGSVKLVVMAVIGGLASIWGAIFGAGATTILSDELLLNLGEWDIVAYGIILMLVMIFTPEGLFVALKSATHWLQHNWRDLPSIVKRKRKELPAIVKSILKRSLLTRGWRKAEP
ncbi:MAG: branched-chain amino acid ABC transporter permease [Chloroflexota bacterium]|nr:branched-chain amino acid ABC transporter permease [Chloroflexota bacterium]